LSYRKKLIFYVIIKQLDSKNQTFSMKKILYLITSSEYGGAQKYVHDLAVNLPPTDYQAIVAAGQGDGELFNQLANFPAVKTIKLFNLQRLPLPLTAWRCLKEIVKLLIQEKPEVLHLNSSVAEFLGSWAAKIYKKKTKANLKVIYTVHGWVFLEPGFGKSLIYLLVEKISAQWKDVFIVLSQHDLQIGLRKKISPKNKLVKIYNGLDIQSLYFLPKEQALKILPAQFQKNNLPIIGTIANFYASKGLAFLIKAMALIRKNFQFSEYNPIPCRKQSSASEASRSLFSIFNLLIIGDGPQRKNLENLIAKLKLNDCIFLAGRMPSAAQYLSAFDIFVLPSVKEGLPYVILEAMAAGAPIVATNVGGLPELIENGKSGLLVEPKNPIALASAIERLLNNPEQQKSLAENAKQQAGKFGLDQMLNQTYQLYN